MFFGVFVSKYISIGSRIVVCRSRNYDNLIRFTYAGLFICMFALVYLLVKLNEVLSSFETAISYRMSLFEGTALLDYYGPYAPYLFFFCTLIPLTGISVGVYSRLNNKGSKMLILSIVLLAIKETILMSRYYLSAPLLAVLLILYCYDKSISKQKVIGLIVVFVISMVALFSLRGDGDFIKNLENARNYMIVGFSLFSKLVDDAVFASDFENLSSSFAFLGLLGTKMYDYNGLFNKVQTFVDLGDAGYFNAFYTSFFFFYMHLGVPGLAVISFVFGLLLNLSHKLYVKNNSIFVFNQMFALLVMFFSHQFLPVQLSFFWDYFILSSALFICSVVFYLFKGVR